jgi:RND family efflux transporter MFP subunit
MRLSRALICLPVLLCVAAGETPRPVRVTDVVLAPQSRRLVFSGTVQARTQAELGFRVAGKVIARPVEVGDHVKAGQILAQIDQADLVLSEQVAEAALQAAKADQANARADFARYEQLGRKSPAFIAAEFDKRSATSRMADARVVQAERQLALAHSQRGYGVLTADADGVVTALPVQSGQVVSAGQTVAVLAHTDAIEVVADVPENRLADVRAADTVSVGLWAAPDQMLRGKVREVGALADAASRTFAVKVSVLEAPKSLLELGMTATVGFDRPTPPLARLPASALTDKNGAPAVWVLNAQTQRAALRPVEVANLAGDGSVLVKSGINAGDKVITAGVGDLTPEMALTVWPGASR